MTAMTVALRGLVDRPRVANRRRRLGPLTFRDGKVGMFRAQRKPARRLHGGWSVASLAVVVALLALGILVLGMLTFNCGMGRKTKRYRLRNSSPNAVRVAIFYRRPGFDVPANSTVDDPEKEEWNETGIDYAVTTTSGKKQRVEYFRVEGWHNIDSVTHGDQVTLTYPPAAPAEVNPRGPAVEAEFEDIEKHPRIGTSPR